MSDANSSSPRWCGTGSGEIRLFGFNFCPRGWIPADGALLPIGRHTALFSLFENNFGGDRTTTFALPNLSDRAPAPSLKWCVSVSGYYPQRD
jgi:microcystin-dependent protein